MGADIKLEGRVAIINGKSDWEGAAVEASDLRAGAALILAGIYAQGKPALAGLSTLTGATRRSTRSWLSWGQM